MERADRWLWCIQPDAEAEPLFQRGASIARALRRQGMVVEPVCVLPDPAFRRTDRGETRIRRWLQGAGLAECEPRLVAVGARWWKLETFRAAALEVLARLAGEPDVVGLVAATRAPRGLGRFLPGSFMESLLERSDVPLLVAGPEARAPEWGKPFERVVFATDFRGDAQSALLGAARVAERFRARLVVVSVLDAIAGQGEEWRRLPIVRRRIAEDRDARRRMLDRWLSLGRIEADVHVDDEGRLAKEGVVELARRSPATVVAMTTRRFGPSWYRGNIASAVVRTAPVPVWLATPSQLSRWLQSPPRREAVA